MLPAPEAAAPQISSDTAVTEDTCRGRSRRWTRCRDRDLRGPATAVTEETCLRPSPVRGAALP